MKYVSRCLHPCRHLSVAVGLFIVFAMETHSAIGAPPTDVSIFSKNNLVAWCIVPFDASKRNPKQRALMLQRLGIGRVAYDWRAEHVPTFEQEILEYKKHRLEFFAFWSQHEEAFRLFEKHGLRPQIWQMMASPTGDTQQAKVKAAAEAMLPLVRRTRKLGSRLGLYNHGGWSGEPQNLVAVCEWLRTHHDADHVGIVYNLHHGHGHIDDFTESLAMMKPYLICLNLNGMNRNEKPKILPIGSGKHERDLLREIQRSGYNGPIGILDHRPDIDTEKSLRQNLTGLKAVLKDMGDDAALRTYDD